MKGSLLEQSLTAPSAHAPLDRRYAERALIHQDVTYTGTEGARFTTSKGSLKDLSKTGCRIVGTTLPAAGVRLTLTLSLEDGQAPLRLTDATVSWIKGNVFAVRFPKLTEDERKRIQATIWKHVTLSKAKQHRTAFHIVP
jgi:c-di-GMP-binding flagellar brake protein YcgR